jgi:hypothetical protein
MTVAREQCLNISFRMIISHSLLQLTMLLIIAITEKQVCKECLLDILLDFSFLICII